MAEKPERHFESIESALEFLALLDDAISDAKSEVRKLSGHSPHDRRLDALRLAQFKLDQLSSHVAKSHRLMNDLRILRRLLFGERRSSSK